MIRVIFRVTLAPGQPPVNVEWNLIGSKLTVHWDPVVTMEMESEVTGYKVSSCILCTIAKDFFLKMTTLKEQKEFLDYSKKFYMLYLVISMNRSQS